MLGKKKRNNEVVQEFEQEFFGKSKQEAEEQRKNVGFLDSVLSSSVRNAFMNVTTSGVLDPKNSYKAKKVYNSKLFVEPYDRSVYEFIHKVAEAARPYLAKYDEGTGGDAEKIAVTFAALLRILIGAVPVVKGEEQLSEMFYSIVSLAEVYVAISTKAEESSRKVHLTACKVPKDTNIKIADSILSNWADAISKGESVLMLRGDSIGIAGLVMALGKVHTEAMGGDGQMEESLNKVAENFIAKPGTVILGVPYRDNEKEEE